MRIGQGDGVMEKSPKATFAESGRSNGRCRAAKGVAMAVPSVPLAAPSVPLAARSSSGAAL
jgi:hypothetical protein